MANSDPLDIIRDALKGIDQSEADTDDGWWETTTGAKFGAERKKIILDTVEKLMEERRLLISALVSLQDIVEIAKVTITTIDKINEARATLTEGCDPK